MHALGEDISARWAARGFDQRQFHAVASEALAQPLDLTAEEVLAWAVRQRQLGPQLDLAAQFGQPPVTVYVSDRFHLEVLFWLDGTTVIHQHGFSGAFRVLAGSSVHTTYRFAEEERVNERLRFGRVARARIELLARGDVRTILPGNGLIHSLFHLDRPSATLVARTTADDVEPQLEYLPPGVALATSGTPASMRRRLQVLGLLLDLGNMGLAREVVGDGDLEQVVRGLLVALRHLVDWDAFLDLFAAARPRLGARADLVLEALDERRRDERLMARRRSVRGADHRFFLALLLNARGRRRVLELVQRRFPDPEARVMAWVRELNELPVAGDLGPTGLGPRLDELTLRVLERLVAGDDAAALATSLAGELDPDDVASLDELVQALRGSDTFQALLAD